MTVTRIYDYVYENKKYLGISETVVIHYDNDDARMYGYFYSDNPFDIARILNTHKDRFKLRMVLR